jgi:hypothetical protein
VGRLSVSLSDKAAFSLVRIAQFANKAVVTLNAAWTGYAAERMTNLVVEDGIEEEAILVPHIV